MSKWVVLKILNQHLELFFLKKSYIDQDIRKKGREVHFEIKWIALVILIKLNGYILLK